MTPAPAPAPGIETLNPEPGTPNPARNHRPIIRPTVGRVVHYFPARGDSEIACNCGPLAAIIARVWDEHLVNLMVVDPNGVPRARTSVHLIQHDDEPRADGQAYCKWMDYQKGQAAKTEQLESRLAAVGSRELTAHKVNALNSAITIRALEPRGAGGASVSYSMQLDTGQTGRSVTIDFQNGPIDKDGNGMNGFTNEALLAILEDRLVGFQSGPFACAENGEALAFVRDAQHALALRTLTRDSAGVEGQHVALPPLKIVDDRAADETQEALREIQPTPEEIAAADGPTGVQVGSPDKDGYSTEG